MTNKTKTSLMNYQDIMDWILHKFHDLKDAMMGSFLYFLYGHFFQNKNLMKGIVSFFIGTVFAIYVSPLFQNWLDWSVQLVSFLTGLLGMRLTEAIVNQDYKNIIRTYLKTKVKN